MTARHAARSPRRQLGPLRRPNLRSVRVRTALGAAAALTVVLAASLAAIGWLVARQVRAAADATLVEQADDRAQLLAGGADPAPLVNVIGDEVVAVVVSADGTVLAAAGTPTPEVAAGWPLGVSDVAIAVFDEIGHAGHENSAGDGAEDGENDGSGDGGEDGEADGVVHTEALRAAVVETATGQRVVVANEGEQAGRTIAATWTILALAGPLIAGAGAVLAWLVTGRALAPVHRLRRDLEEVVSTGVEARVTPPGTDDEIEALAQTVNDVLGRLERLAAVRRRFVADASHELKSPLANARALLETSSPAAHDDLHRDHGVSTGLRADLMGELHRLQNLVDDLLFLARTDETSQVDPAEFDLDDVAFDEAERVEIRTEIRVDASTVQPARVVADRHEVARAIRNLLENAVRHASTTVTVGIEERPAHWVVAVGDDGDGVPEADRERVFERFVRLDNDRARSQGGTGLGLSIVATIAARNGGSVGVVTAGGEAGPGRGARFELSLPKPSAGP